MGYQRRVHGLAAHYVSSINALMGEFWGMNTIDKTQFPLPYAQIVKVLCLIYVYSWPFFMVSGSRYYTPVLAMLLALGFFGLDEVAEILQSPFGNDPNDIQLSDHGTLLMQDLELMFHGRETQLDTVFAEDADVNFSALLSPEQHGAFHRQVTDKTIASSTDCHASYMNAFTSPSPVSREVTTSDIYCLNTLSEEDENKYDLLQAKKVTTDAIINLPHDISRRHVCPGDAGTSHPPIVDGVRSAWSPSS